MISIRRAKHFYEIKSLNARVEKLAAIRRKKFKNQRIVKYVAMSVKSTKRALLNNKRVNS